MSVPTHFEVSEATASGQARRRQALLTAVTADLRAARCSCPGGTHLTRSRGFTLIELMVTLVIATLLLTMGIPALSNMLQNNRLSAQTNQFVTAINFARSEAIKRSADIDVTAINSANDTNEWGPGWRVLVGATVLRTFPALDGSSTLNSVNNQNTYRYSANGRVSVADTLNLCDGRTGETGRLITITATGRVATEPTACP